MDNITTVWIYGFVARLGRTPVHYGCCFFLLCCLLPQSALSQQAEDFKKIDRRAVRAPKALHKDLPALTAYLTENTTTEVAKVRAIYTWMTTQLSYDAEAIQQDKRINQNIADILRRKKALCIGYAQLFKAMCTLADLRCEIVSGYSKNTQTTLPDLTRQDHAWNVVQIDGQWHLIDVTWGSSIRDRRDDFVQVASEAYFLTPPTEFILHHLSGDPRWQLLPCPLPLAEFNNSASAIKDYLSTTDTCFQYLDSIAYYFSLPESDRALQTARATYHFNPTEANGGEYAHALIDRAFTLADTAADLQQTDRMPDLIALQDRILALLQQAQGLTTLFDWQQQLYLQTIVNQAVALFRLAQAATTDQRKIHYAKAHQYLLQGQTLLETIPPSNYTNMIRGQLDDYLRVLEEQ